MSKPAAQGVVDGRLAPCPDAPHCVCSDGPESAAAIAPLTFDDDPATAFARARAAVSGIGGVVVEATDDYLHATFTSTVFRFVDDLELRLDPAGVIQVRSSSRVGYYDFGANRARVEKLRRAFGA